MDRNGRPSLTRPDTPQAFKVAGRYSFIPPKDEEEVKVPARLLIDVVDVPGTK